METKDYFVIVRCEGNSERIEKWTVADIHFFVRTLRQERQDLYEQLEELLVPNGTKRRKYSFREEEGATFVAENHERRDEDHRLSFECKLESWQFERIAEVANAEGIFAYPSVVTGEILESFFFLKGVKLQVRNLRLFCAMMSALSNYGYIKRYWQAPIYKGRLLRAYEKDGYVNRSDLTTANYAINSVLVDGRVERISKVVKGLKEQRH